MTKATLRIIIALAIVCCTGAMIVTVHLPDSYPHPEVGNVTPEGSPLGSDLPGGISSNATPNEVPEEMQEVRNMTPERSSQGLYVHPFVRQALEEANMTAEVLPEELTEEIEQLQRSYEDRKFGISGWEFDSENKLVIIYAYSILDEKKVKAIQGRQAGGWTFKVIHNLDYENERKQAAAELMQFQNDHPELEISGFIITSPAHVEMWVRNRTPENEALNGTVMYGRTIELIGGAPREELMMREELKRNEPASREPEAG